MGRRAAASRSTGAIAVREVAGIEIVPWAPSHHEACRQVNNAAFADHWGSTLVVGGDWLERIREAGTRVDLSFVALAEGEVVGHLVERALPEPTSSSPADGTAGSGRLQCSVSGVTAGSARRWSSSSLRAFAAEGLTHAMLGVDTENQTGAVALYRALGFEPLTRSTTFELAVPALASSLNCTAGRDDSSTRYRRHQCLIRTQYEDFARHVLRDGRPEARPHRHGHGERVRPIRCAST